MAKQRIRTVAALIIVYLVAGGGSSVLAQANLSPDLTLLVEGTISAKARQPLPSCPQAIPSSTAGLAVRDGNVTAANLIREIGGYAGAAGTTGGLGGRLLVVTTLADYGAREAAVPGSLRAHLDVARRDRMPAWIIFDPALGRGARLALKQTLRIPSNVTIDGSCADITLEAPDDKNVMLAYIADGTRNVIITRLAMRKFGYVSEAHPDAGSAIRVNGDFDRIAILHNDLSECGDGCIDITVSPGKPVPTMARITVAYNFIHHHDKVMLFGTYTCPQIEGLNQCDKAYVDKSWQLSPGLLLTLDGNLFLRTGQRHPRIFGQVMAHVLNNLVAFASLRRANGQRGASYGVFASNAARALIEANLFIPLERGASRPLAVWTVGSPGASRMTTDAQGFVRLRQNRALRDAVLTQDRPSEVPDAPYAYDTIPLAEMPLEKAMACLVDRAGRSGGQAWNSTLCAP